MNKLLQTPIQTQHIQAVGITVKDVDRVSEFYTKALGFEMISDRIIEDKNFAESQESPLSKITATLKLGDEQIRLMQYIDIKGKPIPQDSQSNDLWFQHLAIVVSDMDRAYSHLQSLGIEFISAKPQTIPPENKEAAYIQAFKFRDPDRHPLELIWFPPDKGQKKWHQKSDRLFLGIDHTAIAIKNTEQSLQFYRDFLGMRVEGGSFNWGETQAKLDGLPDAKVRITALRPPQGGLGIELLHYIEPANGRPIPCDLKPYDIAYMQVELITDEINKGSDRLHQTPIHSNAQIKDPTGHSLLIN